MNIIEALQALNEGKKVRFYEMPEGDYLYKQGNKIMAYMARFKASFESNLNFRRLFRKNIAEIYEEPKPILDTEEKAYLEAVLKPFKDRVVSIHKNSMSDLEYLCIIFKGDGYSRANIFTLPSFKSNTMYKGMKKRKDYTLKELGLFQEEGE